MKGYESGFGFEGDRRNRKAVFEDFSFGINIEIDSGFRIEVKTGGLGTGFGARAIRKERMGRWGVAKLVADVDDECAVLV